MLRKDAAAAADLTTTSSSYTSVGDTLHSG